MKLYLHREDIELHNEVSRTTAFIIMRDIWETNKLKKSRAVSIKSYCKYFMIDKEDVWEMLKSKKAS